MSGINDIFDKLDSIIMKGFSNNWWIWILVGVGIIFIISMCSK
jgi:hypothetical protein